MAPTSAPNCNVHLDRFNGSFKWEAAAERVICFGGNHMRRLVDQYLLHYHHERNHHGLDSHNIESDEEICRLTGSIRQRERLGGTFHYY